MSLKPMSMRPLPAILAFVLAVPLASAQPSKDEADVVAAFRKDMRAADGEERARLIATLAETGSSGAPEAIAKYLYDPSPQVVRAAAGALGRLRDPKSLTKLLKASKKAERTPEVLPAVVAAIGEFESPTAVAPLYKLALKWFAKDSKVASAIGTALGKVADRAAVEALVNCIVMTYPVQAHGHLSDETMYKFRDARPAVLDALEKLTGWRFTDARAWRTWWSGPGKRWEPDAPLPDLEKLQTWDDPGYLFAVARPGVDWKFGRVDGFAAVLQLAEGDETLVLFRVKARDLRVMRKPVSAKQEADSLYAGHRSYWQSLGKRSVTAWRIGKDKGVDQSFSCVHSSGKEARVRILTVVHKEVLFSLDYCVQASASPAAQDQIEKLVASFRFTD